jgi:hypothetical protein
MAPKQIKKTTEETPKTESIDILMKEWAEIAKEETTIDEAKNAIIKRKEAMITKLWAHLNKNPTEQIVTEKPVEKVAEVEKPKKAPIKKSKASEEEVVEEKPKKAPTKKVKASEEVVEEKPKKEVPVKVATKKVSAPPKGSAKPKPVTETEVKKLENESSSETDVDSLSSVSSESDGSDGGED